MTDNDNLVPDFNYDEVLTVDGWDRLYQSVNNNRRYRLAGMYTIGTISYNGSNLLTWTEDIKILFMSINSDNFFVNTISASTLGCTDNNIIYCKLNNSDTTASLSSSTKANFKRSGLGNETGNIIIIGFTDADKFHYISGGVTDHTELSSIGTNTHTEIDTHISNAHSEYTDGDAIDAIEGVLVTTPVAGDWMIYRDDVVLKRALLSSLTHAMLTGLGGKYTDSQVDTIVLAHKNVGSAHHAKYTDGNAVSAMGSVGDSNDLNHVKYTHPSANHIPAAGSTAQHLIYASAGVAQWSTPLVRAGSTPSGTTAYELNGYFYATKVYNAVYNDYADYWGKLPDDEIAIAGKTYVGLPNKGITKATKRNDSAVLGICSDSYGFAVGKKVGDVPLSVCGFILAFVDTKYNIGTRLINDENGNLTKAIGDEKFDAIAKLVSEVKEKGRYWVKVLL